MTENTDVVDIEYDVIKDGVTSSFYNVVESSLLEDNTLNIVIEVYDGLVAQLFVNSNDGQVYLSTVESMQYTFVLKKLEIKN